MFVLTPFVTGGIETSFHGQKSTVKTFTGFQQTARKPGIPSEHWEHTSELKLRVLHLSADAGKETLVCSVRFA